MLAGPAAAGRGVDGAIGAGRRLLQDGRTFLPFLAGPAAGPGSSPALAALLAPIARPPDRCCRPYRRVARA